jgi:hypothetical protein
MASVNMQTQLKGISYLQDTRNNVVFKITFQKFASTVHVQNNILLTLLNPIHCTGWLAFIAEQEPGTCG